MTDIVIAGGGPGGIAAAVTAAEQGANVTVVDDNPHFGGQIWRRGIYKSSHKEAAAWLQKIEKSSIKFKPSNTVIDRQGSDVVCFSEKDGVSRFSAEKLILANGARELFLPFPGWTLPGVMGCGGAQAMVKGGMQVEGKKVVVSGSGPLLLAVAASLVKAGADLQAVVEQAASSKLNKFAFRLLGSPGKLIQGIGYRLKTLKAPYLTGSWVKEAVGDNEVTSIQLGGKHEGRQFECDLLACAYGLVPNSELAALLGCEREDDFVTVDKFQMTSADDIYAVGELTGIGGVDKAVLEGRIAGLAACGVQEPYKNQKRKIKEFSNKLSDTFKLNDEVKSLADSSTQVCRCEDVSYKDLASCKDQRSAKLYTRCGMGACQGRICSAACKEIFGWERNKVNTPLIPIPAEVFIDLG